MSALKQALQSKTVKCRLADSRLETADGAA
jgi:hypothetical protein